MKIPKEDPFPPDASMDESGMLRQKENVGAREGRPRTRAEKSRLLEAIGGILGRAPGTTHGWLAGAGDGLGRFYGIGWLGSYALQSSLKWMEFATALGRLMFDPALKPEPLPELAGLGSFEALLR